MRPFDVIRGPGRKLIVKRIAVLPTLLTLGNGMCGFAAIAYASKIPAGAIAANNADTEFHFAMAGWFILFAMVFDMLDGYVARLSKTASDFGGQLDSLCDVVSFGITPAFLLLKLGPGWDPSPFLHQLAAGIAALYFCCAALRLARFNVENSPDPTSHKRFRGLPSPGAAGCIAGFAIFRGEFATTLQMRFPELVRDQLDPLRDRIAGSIEAIAPIGALLVALLMVSHVPFPHLTGKIFRGKKHIGHLVQVLLAGFILLMFRSLAPLLVFWGYALFFPIRSALVRNLRPEKSPVNPPV